MLWLDEIKIRQASRPDIGKVSSVLAEAAQWAEDRGMPMWRNDELTSEHIARDVTAGYFFLAECAGEVAGTIKFQLQDPLFWSDTPEGEAAFVHRLAIRRTYSGGQLSNLLLKWAVDRAAALGRRYLRLDCEADRPRLRAVYERFGFRHHSDRRVGPYFVSRYELPLGTGRRPDDLMQEK
ncbi:MAG TPA: GNAT family N-acetyltransferase [Chthoniobacterales bacterium]|nr:GNAT family N-acetyltransferase [Chthoniobacterales bacterium]